MSALRQKRRAEILLETPRSETTKTKSRIGSDRRLGGKGVSRAKLWSQKFNRRRWPDGFLRGSVENFGQGDGKGAPFRTELRALMLLKFRCNVTAAIADRAFVCFAVWAIFYFTPLRPVKYSTIAPTSSGATGAL
jgi:hypothetical protein